MSKKKLTIIIIGSVILLLGIGVAIYFVSSDVECEPNTDFTKTYCDNEGNWIKSESYDGDGNLISRIWYADGKRIKVEEYDDEGNLEHDYRWEFDGKGNLIKREWYDADGNLGGYWLRKYDDEGNWIKSESYDGDGNLIE